MAIHFRYGGSTAKRTLACPGWRAEADKAPKIPRDNSNATRGSALHDLLERCINDGTVADRYAGCTVPVKADGAEYTVNTLDVDEMNDALRAAQAVMDKYKITEFVTEQLVQASDLVGGSADLIGCGDEWVLVLDWKMGYSYVSAHANEQAAFYAMCGAVTPAVADMFTGRKVVVAIIQPKISAEADVYEFDDDELRRLQKDLRHATVVAEAGTGALATGDHCQYCPAAAYCPAKRTQAMTFLHLDPQQSDELAAAMDLVEDMKAHIKAVEAEVFAALENDEQIPGWKLVLKQSRRHWIDEEATELMLRKANLPETTFLDTSLKSVAQLEKSLKKTGREINLEKFFTTSSSGTTIAPATDKRPAVAGKNQMPDALASIMKQTN